MQVWLRVVGEGVVRENKNKNSSMPPCSILKQPTKPTEFVGSLLALRFFALVFFKRHTTPIIRVGGGEFEYG